MSYEGECAAQVLPEFLDRAGRFALTISAVPYTGSKALAKRVSMQWQQRASSVERLGLTNAVMAMRKSPL